MSTTTAAILLCVILILGTAGFWMLFRYTPFEPKDKDKGEHDA